MKNCHHITAPGIGRKIDPLEDPEAGTQSTLRLSRFPQRSMSTPPNRRSKGLKGGLRFVCRTFGSMPGQAKLTICAIIMLWVVLFTLEVLPNMYFPLHNQTTFEIRDLPHDTEMVSSLKAFKTTEEQATTITQSEFVSSVELAEQEEIEKGAAEDVTDRSTPQIEDQTMTSEDKAQIVERMKRHVTFINVTEEKRLIGFSSPKPKKPTQPRGQGSAFKVLGLRKVISTPSRVHQRVGANGKRGISILLSRPEPNRARRQVKVGFESKDNEEVHQPQIEENEIGPRPVKNDGDVSGASSKKNSTSKQDQSSSSPPALLSPAADGVNDADVADDVKDAAAADDPDYAETTNDASAAEASLVVSSTTAAPPVDPYGLETVTVTERDISYEESLMIADEQRLQNHDYMEPGMEARLAKRYPRWKKNLVAGLPL